MKITYTITGDNITVFHNGKIFTINKSSRHFSDLKEHLKQPFHDVDYLETILDIKELIARHTQGNVKIVGNDVYYKDNVVRTRLGERLIELFDDGFDVSPWINFMEKVMQNPSEDARERLFIFLEKNESPITEDGDFITFKRIRKNWTDIHSGTMSNKPGTIVEMPRESVDDNNVNTCSRGLHVAASHYLDKGPTIFANAPNSRTIVCKVNPIDVVAVPPDYNETKMRVCRYEVLSEIIDGAVGSIREIEENKNYGDYKKHDYSVPKPKTIIEEKFDAELEQIAKVIGNSNLKMSRADEDYYVIFIDIDVGQMFKFGVKFLRHVISSVQGTTYSDYDYILRTKYMDQDIHLAVADDDEKVIYVYTLDPYNFDGLSDDDFDIKSIAKNLIEANNEVNYYVGDEPKHEYVEPEKESLTFMRNGDTFTQTQILEGVKNSGSITKWANSVGVPRSTAQDWVKKIINN